MEIEAQAWFEQYGGLSKGFERRSFELAAPPPRGGLFPYAAGAYGSGANMAFRTAALRAIGGFDPALGAGTRAQGGDDLAAFFDNVSAVTGWSTSRARSSSTATAATTPACAARSRAMASGSART
jgi:O-antigen biosynthesis protein